MAKCAIKGCTLRAWLLCPGSGTKTLLREVHNLCRWGPLMISKFKAFYKIADTSISGVLRFYDISIIIDK